MHIGLCLRIVKEKTLAVGLSDAVGEVTLRTQPGLAPQCHHYRAGGGEQNRSFQQYND